MTISEVIARLQELKDTHGDLPVYIEDDEFKSIALQRPEGIKYAKKEIDNPWDRELTGYEEELPDRIVIAET